MALQHVAHHSGAVVVAAPRPHPGVFGHRDLHPGDAVAVPRRLEQGVGEAEHQQVLHGLFAQVVVDAIDLALGEVPVHQVVELAGRGQVAAEGLLHHQARPARGAGQAGGVQAGDHPGQGCRGQRQVEDPVAGEGVLGLDGFQAGGEGAVVAVGGKRGVVQAGGAPGRGGFPVETGGGQGLPRAAAELFVAQVVGARPEHHGVEAVVRGEAIQGGQELAGAQVAGGTHDHEQVSLGGGAHGRGLPAARGRAEVMLRVTGRVGLLGLRASVPRPASRVQGSGGSSAWYSQASNRASRSAPLISSARAMNSAVDPLP